MKFDFSKVEEIEDFISVPNGSYPCRIAEVRERTGDDGTARWSLRWEVEDGPFAGRTAAWDNLSWSEKGVRRVKLVLDKLGFAVQGELEIEPGLLVGKRAIVTVFAQEYQDPVTQRRVMRTRVPFAGYQPAKAAAAGQENGDELPF